MEGEGILQLIAELAIGVMGFSGVVAVLGRRASGSWSPIDRTRFIAMVRQTVFVLFLSLLPIALHYVGLRSQMIWGGASAVGAILAVGLPIFLKDARPDANLRELWSDPRVGRFALVYGGAAALVVPALLGLNAVSLVLHREFGPYLVALLLQFGVPITLFVRLLRTAVEAAEE